MTPSAPNPTWYDVLGVSRDASPAEIKAAWRNATDKFEPGSGSGQFRMFNEAADVLLDPERRAAYDASLDADQAEAPADAQPPAPTAEEPAPPPPPPVRRADGCAVRRTPTPRRSDDVSAPSAERQKAATRSATPYEPASRRAGILLAVLALLTVAALVAAGFFALQVREDARTADARDEAPGAAETAAEGDPVLRLPAPADRPQARQGVPHPEVPEGVRRRRSSCSRSRRTALPGPRSRPRPRSPPTCSAPA